MEIKRHNWFVGDRAMLECATIDSGLRKGATCAGCGVHVALEYLDIVFDGSHDHYADADVVAAPRQLLAHRAA